MPVFNGTIYALYARVSTDEQNINQQIQTLKEFCRNNNYQYRTYSDKGLSGKVEDRPQWKKLLKDLEKGKIQGLIVFNTDRVTRDGVYAYKFLKLYDTNNFEFISLTNHCNLKTADGRFNFKLYCLLSEREIDQIKERMKPAVKRMKKEGKFHGRMPGSKNKPKK